MVKLKINKQEIEKMIMDQFGVDSIKWDKNGNVEIEMDIENINKKEKPLYFGGGITYINPNPITIDKWDITCGPSTSKTITNGSTITTNRNSNIAKVTYTG